MNFYFLLRLSIFSKRTHDIEGNFRKRGKLYRKHLQTLTELLNFVKTL